MSRIFLVLLLVFVSSVSLVFAYAPNMIGVIPQNEVHIIDDPIQSQSFYGVLDNFPHTYKIVRNEPFTLSLSILQPHIDTSNNNVSAIVVKLPAERGRVEEVTRLRASLASWDTFYDPVGGDRYRQGPEFEGILEAGSYIIEVHTPENLEKYVLKVGTEDEESIGYFKTLLRLIEVKKFFDKSPLRIVESPYIYVPLIIFISIGLFLYRRMKRRARN